MVPRCLPGRRWILLAGVGAAVCAGIAHFAVVWTAGNVSYDSSRVVRTMGASADMGCLIIVWRGWGFQRAVVLQRGLGPDDLPVNAEHVFSGSPLTDAPSAGMTAEELRGWPMMSARCEWTFTEAGQEEPQLFGGAGPREGWPAPPGRPWRVLPLEPVWPGLAVNLMVYFGAVFLPVVGGAAALAGARRRRRAQRGHCQGCGYPMPVGGGVCPECGGAMG